MKEDLIHLWIANGFISSRENLDAEDVGNEVWNELYHKSFFQDVKTKRDGDVYFKMHDLVHDLAQFVMGKECLVTEEGSMVKFSRGTHYIHYQYGSNQSLNKKDLKMVESLRTLLLPAFFPTISSRWQTHCSLRVLRTNTLPVLSLDHLIHLRYLELLRVEIDTLPKSICSLRKLEILKLCSCYELRYLPEELTCLWNLRHLVISRCSKLTRMPPNIGKLSCLRTLSVFIAGSKRGHSLAELRDLKLGGKLSIGGLKNVASVSEAREANLIGKKDLQQLKLSWHSSDETDESHGADAEQVIEALQPYSNLKCLELDNYEGSRLPGWMGDNSVLSSLVSLKLDKCQNCVQLPPLSGLPSLKKLTLRSMEYVRYLAEQTYDGVEKRAFESLETLELKAMPNLERFLKMEEAEMFPCLSSVDIVDCPKLKLPCLPSVERLFVRGGEEELLRSVSSCQCLTSLRLFGSDVTSLPEGMMKNLTSLKFLSISFGKLKELPSQLMSLHALEELDIGWCGELESIAEQALEGLSSLRIWRIVDCKRLKCLPQSVGHLNSLERLVIYWCPKLEERCKEGTGEDWHKIAHVPNVVFC